MTLRWPCVLTPNDIEVDLVPRPQGGGPSLAGGSQWVQSDAGCWEITYGSLPVSRARVNAFRSYALQLNGPATPILVPVFDSRHSAWPTINGVRVSTYGDIPHDDGMVFSDGTGYGQDVIIATASSASFRSTSLEITVTVGGALQGGEFFSIGEYLYEIATAVVTSDGPPTIYNITFLPPLREGIDNNTVLNFDTPAARCTLASPGGMPLSLSNRIVGLPSVSFIEDFAG